MSIENRRTYTMRTKAHGAGRRNRTDDLCVEGRCFTSKLYPHTKNTITKLDNEGQAINWTKLFQSANPLEPSSKSPR